MTATATASPRIEHGQQHTHVVHLSLIQDPKSNQRLEEAERPEDLNALAADMHLNGQMQPIGVVCVPGSDEYRLVWGSRRLRAAAINNWSAIACVVVPPNLDEAQLTAAENLHRRAMNALEECLACETLMQRHAALPPSEAHAKVAEALGKSATWVRDRLFLTRLCPEARAKVNDGSLPLGHARELAKVVDPHTQENLLRAWFGEYKEPPPLEQCRDEVNRSALSLKQVPWLLDADKVARGCPPCTTCPSNTANARAVQLFEHDAPEDSDAVPHCLSASCFEKKQRAASDAIAEAAKAAAKMKTPAARVEKALEKAPAFVKPKALKAAVAAKVKLTAPPTKSRKDEPDQQPSRQGEWDRQAAERRVRQSILAERANLRADRMLAELPGGATALAVIESVLNEIGHGGKKSAFGNMFLAQAKTAKVPPLIQELLDALTAKDFEVLVATLDKLVDPVLRHEHRPLFDNLVNDHDGTPGMAPMCHAAFLRIFDLRDGPGPIEQKAIAEREKAEAAAKLKPKPEQVKLPAVKSKTKKKAAKRK